MTDTTWACTPAGTLGRGGADVRPYPGAFAELQGGAGRRMRPLDGTFAVRLRAHEPATGRGTAQKFTRNDITILGFHTPGRPRS